jgi:hypothetical protein
MVNIFHRASVVVAALATVGLTPPSQLAAAPTATPAPADPRDFSTSAFLESPAAQRLMEMFSPEIQAVLGACVASGGVDLDAGAAADGGVICADGATVAEVAYSEYVNTLSDLLAASGLVGFRTVLDANPQISPELIATYAASSQGSDMLRTAIEMGISQSQLLPSITAATSTVLVNEVLARLLPTLQDPAAFANLLGSSDQYQQVVNRFCTAPGMSVEQANTAIPGLSSLQLYSICVAESGIAEQVQQMLTP